MVFSTIVRDYCTVTDVCFVLPKQKRFKHKDDIKHSNIISWLFHQLFVYRDLTLCAAVIELSPCISIYL